MALGTRAPEKSQEDIDREFDDIANQNQDLDNRIDREYASNHGTFQPEQLRDAESAGADIDDIGSEDADGNDYGSGVREAESTPLSNWANRVKGGAGGAKQPFTLKNLAGKFKSKKAIAGISVAGIVSAAGISLSMLLSPSMLMVHVKELGLSRYNIQDTSTQERNDIIVAKKINGTGTKGCTGAGPKLTCRYKLMSNRMLKDMSDRGIVAYKNGEPIDVSDGSKWATNRPDEFRPVGDAANSFNLKKGQKGVSAREFSTFLRNNPAATGVFRKAFNPRWAAFWDSTMVKFLNKIGFGGRGLKIEGDDQESVEKSVKENADKAGDGKSLDADKNKREEGDDDAKKKANADADADSDKSAKEINDTANSSKTDPAGLGNKISKIGKSGLLAVVSMYCLVTNDAPKISRALRAAQMAQMIPFALSFIQSADEVKLSNNKTANAATIAAIGLMMTQSKKNSSGKYVKKSAMESDGMLYLLAGNTKFLGEDTSKKTSDIRNWIPGGGVMTSIVNMGNKLSGSDPAFKKFVGKSCDALDSPAGQMASTLFIDTNPLGLAAQAAMMGAMTIVQSTPAYQAAMDKLFKALAGKIIHNTDVMEDLGNIIANGFIYSMGESGNAGANMPMTVNDAVAYGKLTTERRIADAKVDRATLSPLDASSPNTFMGSIVTKMLPYYGALHSGPFEAMGAITGIVSNTLPSMFTQKSSAYADLTRADLTSCEDTGITGMGIAADPICNIQYGIPTKYLTSIDPEENTQKLISSNMVTEDGTGGGYEDDDSVVKGSKLEEFLTKCRQNPETTASPECMIDTDEKASYAVYYIDHRIQKNMDGEDEYKSDASVTAASGSDSGSSATAGSGAAIGDYKPGSYQCAAWVGQLVLPDIYGIPNPFGNGNQIAPNLGAKGYKVDNTPAVHAVVSWPAYCNCQGGSSSAGHVGIVDAVNADGSIVVEAYNSHGDEKYAVTTITAANAKKLQYAHVESKFGTGPVKVGAS